MFSKVLVFVLLGASFVAANPIYNPDYLEDYELRGAVRDSIKEWVTEAKEKIRDILKSGKENFGYILKKINHDRVKIETLTNNKIMQLGNQLAGIKKEVKSGIENHKDSWKNRLEKLKEEGKSLVGSSFNEALHEIDEGFINFIEKRIKSGKTTLIELIEEIKQVLSEPEQSEESNEILNEQEQSENINQVVNEQEQSENSNQVVNEQKQLEGKPHEIIESEKENPESLISDLAESMEPFNDVNLDDSQNKLETNVEQKDEEVPMENKEKLDDRLHDIETQKPKQQFNPTEPKAESFNEDYVDPNDQFEEAEKEEKSEDVESDKKELDRSDDKLEKVDSVNSDFPNSNESNDESPEVKQDSFLFEDQIVKEEKKE